MLPSLIPLQQPRSADAVVGRGERGPRPEEDGGGAAVEFRSWLRLKTRRRSVEPLGEPGDFWGLPRRRAPSPSRPYLFTAINDIFSAALRARGGGHNRGLVRGEQWLDNPPSDCVDIPDASGRSPRWSRRGKRARDAVLAVSLKPR